MPPRVTSLVVLDASVLAAVFLVEPEGARAEAMMRAARRLAAPDILPLEVGSALTRRVRRGELAAEDARRALGELGGAGVRLHSHLPLLGPATELSLAHRHPLPDCLYLALAREEGASLATFDRRLAALAERIAIPLWSPETP